MEGGEVAAVAPVEVSYQQLLDQSLDLSAEIEQAFGPQGLGIITVSGVPNFASLRRRLLPLAAQFARLPAEVKARYEDPASLYNFGWSHGRETLESGQRDQHKGSFYANPTCDVPTTDARLLSEFPAYCRPNIWPGADLPGLEPSFKALGGLIVDVGLLLAQHCDRHMMASCAVQGQGRLHDIIAASPCPKGRLLHYFPAPPGSAPGPAGSWCGWHRDHGSLTGLVAAMYLDPDLQEVQSPDPQTGLYIRNRAGDTVKAVIPPGNIAFQVGQAWEIESEGRLCATPHAVVRGGGGGQGAVSRDTFAVFLQPRWDFVTKQGITFGEFTKNVLAKNYN